MRELVSYNKPLSIALFVATSLLLGSCGAPDRLKNEDLEPDAVKELVRGKLIAPIDDERLTEFNERIPRRSLLQVIHGPDSLSDPSFIRLIENQLSDELRFKLEQREEVSEAPETESTPEPIQLSDEEKKMIESELEEDRSSLIYGLAFDLEDTLISLLTSLENKRLDKQDDALPFSESASNFPAVIGKNLTEDESGFLAFPADVFLIGGQDSSLISRTSVLQDHVVDLEYNLVARELPLKDVLSVLSYALDLEYTFSAGVEETDRLITLSVKSGALSILDALLTQNDLAIIYNADKSLASFYTGAEVQDIRAQMRDAIVGYNEILKNKKELEKVEGDIARVKQMIEITHLLLDGDVDGFLAEVKQLPRINLGPEARDGLKAITTKRSELMDELERFDVEAIALLNPTAPQATGGDSPLAVNRALSDILVEDRCIKLGEEIFIEKIAVYNAKTQETIDHLETFFPGVNDAAKASDTTSSDEAEEADSTEADDATDETSLEDGEEVAQNISDNCPTTYAARFQTDATGVIASGRRADNTLAIKLIESFDVPRLQVLVEIFMVTVTRDFDRRVANLITQLRNGVGGSGSQEAQLLNNTTVVPNNVAATPGGTALNPSNLTSLTPDASSPDVRVLANENLLTSNFLAGISSAVSNGYAVNLRSPNGYIASALSFLETNELGRVLSSPTILVEHGETAEIIRERTAIVEFDLDNPDNASSSSPTAASEPLTGGFTLKLTDVNVNPSNLTVQLKVEIGNKIFDRPIASILRRSDGDFTDDQIKTTFTTAPGDVIVLAGMSANEESSLTEGLPGTSTLGLAAPVLGGSDRVTANFSEMVIFLAPTVIDPSSDFRPHSAF